MLVTQLPDGLSMGDFSELASQSPAESPLIQEIVLAEISRVIQPMAVRAALLMSQRATDLDDSALKQIIFAGGGAYSIDPEGIGRKNASSQTCQVRIWDWFAP